MTFRIRGLSPSLFKPLFDLPDEALLARGARRVVIDEPHAAPCRVSLQDAEPGERCLLLPFEHQPAASPFKASGPIFVREAASQTCDSRAEVPAAIARRTLSVRAYDPQAMMLDGELVEGMDLAGLLENWFARPEVDLIHIHYARRGCYAALAERA